MEREIETETEKDQKGKREKAMKRNNDVEVEHTLLME